VTTICDYAGGVIFVSYDVGMVNCQLFTFWGIAQTLIYCMSRDLYGVITRAARVINNSMNFWRELLINCVYLAAVLALVYILTYTDIVSHLLAY
jgi:hypothetical protein